MNKNVLTNRFISGHNNYGGNTIDSALQNRNERFRRRFDANQITGLYSSNGEEVLTMHLTNASDKTLRVALFAGQFNRAADLNDVFGENVAGIIGYDKITGLTVDNEIKLKSAVTFFNNVPTLAQQLDVTVDNDHLSQLSKSIRELRYYPLRDLGSRDIVLQTKLRTTQTMQNKVVVQPNVSFNNQTILIMDIISGADVTLIWTLDGSINIPNELEKAWSNGLL